MYEFINWKSDSSESTKKIIMKKKFYIFFTVSCCFFICSTIHAELNTSNNLQKAETTNTDEYHLVWQDNFEKGYLDENNWFIEVNGDGGGNAELQYYRSENVSVGIDPETSKSCLILTAKKEAFQNKHFTSGRINTRDRMSFKYGKIEASIKLPETANGLWPAFWMLGSDHAQVDWPKCGEIDILEMGHVNGIKNGTQDRLFNGACHWGTHWDQVASYAKDRTENYSLQDDFHLYTLIWDEKSVKMYLDIDKYPNVQPYFEMNIDGVENSNSPGHYFNKPFFVILNLAVGGHFTGITGNENLYKITALTQENNFESNMYVDYIRVYQKGISGEEYFGPTLESGIKPVESSTRYSIYPNPAVSEVKISGPDIPAIITFYDSSGQEIAVFKNTDFCNILELSAGIYLMKIEDKNGYSEIHQLIKK